ncbi:apolipoprotein N-acyltransferase [Leptolyngbya sp. FACHB-671]|uniref:apolipoprotein N-acyltransferase n=1 Tax=Leptolyngbya sp. FACHB-671 TaxID=2692812 RepID=UPI001682C8EA|nr:apolipoprotein N-acyltransferase [Leptolyngbya sp. FACHB-671]MBD2071168.1 apolipoprotein N-acyltransferase [Leptolyngbya sp. FACHB-671]
MGLTPAPVNAWFLAWVALVPLWVLVAKSSSLKSKLALGFVWGLGFHGLALSWITGLHPLTWMGVPWLASLAIALFCWLFITAWGALLVLIWAGSFKLLERSNPRAANARFLPLVRVLMGVAVWCVLEGIWSSGALWWTSLSYTQSPHNLLILHLGQLTGPSAATAAIVAVNGLLAEAWLARSHPPEPLPSHAHTSSSDTSAKLYLAIAATLLLGLHLLGFSLYSRPLTQPPETAVRVGLIQGNVPTRIKLYEEGVRRAFNAYMTGYDILADQNVDIVFTPEGALPIYWMPSIYQSNPVYQSLLNRGVPLILGSFGRQDEQITQSLFAIAGNGEMVGRYNKVKLVPLGEYIPFGQFLGSLINRLSPVEASMIPGALEQQFDTPVGRAIAGICYESAFSKLFRVQAANGGEFILTASNNDPYSSTMMFQHHAQDVMRAIETDRWAARVTNTGYSGIVDPHGKTRWLSDNNIYEIHADTIYRRQTRSLYVQWGDWLTPLLLISALTVELGIRIN